MEGINLKKRPEESFDEYCHRISSMRVQLNKTWDHIAAIINANCGCDYSADKYRKQEKKYQNSLQEESENTAESIDADSEDSEDLEDVVFCNAKESISTNFEKNETTSSKEMALTPEQLRNPDALLRAHGFDPSEFSIKNATNTKTTRSTITGDTSIYVSKITVKAKDTAPQDIKAVAKELEDFRAPRLNLIKSNKDSDEYLVVPLYDLHFGRLPDVEEFEKYDVNEEKQRIIDHVARYVEKFAKRDFNKIYLIIGQDFLNSSFTGYTSSQSHMQSNAIDFRTMLRAGSELLISIIDMFARKCNQLEVVCSLGNHDIAEETALFLLLRGYYRHETNIIVDDSFAPRKYKEIGNACVGFGHLDKESKRAFGLMQLEAKDIWSHTRSHVFISGHLHHFAVSNENGVELYRIPAICPPDRWTREQGYVMNDPKTMCFIFNQDDGLIETHFMYL